ncbi:unnamed protein product [Rotaria sp. Silwood2]|nr:unnamed protein product [Rotaria sp. Silwood2]CAF2698539.1 unnamed protein product [Rotaria sp. Silwood2]CAF2838514.1 unnamed protein product [Rotaria sp. Silwood2]CAF3910298.1 unnamed protein product [Rotaria sp. Silwood2]CAF4009589.1 unnamed protein product [Rotaria sp. Silwood2]
MLTLILLIFLTIGVSTINSYTCTCCFSSHPDMCQTPAINLPSCANCTGAFCANHIKGCQGSPPCDAECKGNSTSISTTTKTSTSISITTKTSSMRPISTTSNNAFTLRFEFIMISVGLTLLAFIN